MDSGSGGHPETRIPSGAAVPEADGKDRPLRSGAWPRQVKVEITRIEHRLQIALVNNKSAYAKAVGNAIRAHLRDAEAVIRPRNVFARRLSPVDWYRGTSIEQAYRSLHAARVFLVELVADEDVDALVPGVLARVQSCLPATDPQRIELEKLPRVDQKTKRAKLVRALERVGFQNSSWPLTSGFRLRVRTVDEAAEDRSAQDLAVNRLGDRRFRTWRT
jgi:hypothetical protein